jgi:hypothetical protein
MHEKRNHRMRPSSFSPLWLCFVVTLFLLSLPSKGQSVYLSGAESKAAGMESALRADGPPSLLYNPANLSRGYGDQWSQPYLEVGFYQVNYTYEHPDYDPITVTTTSPSATLGYGYRLHEKVTYGVLLFPESQSQMTVPMLPINLGEETKTVTLDKRDLTTHGAVGAAFEVGYGVALGMSMIATYEDHREKITAANKEDIIGNVSYRNVFYRPNIGLRYIPRDGLRTAISIRPPMTKTYRGSQTIQGNETTTSPRIIDYKPTAINAGIGANIRPLTVNLEAQYEIWKEGSNVIKNNFVRENSRADLKNITQISSSMGYRFSKFHVVSIGYAHLPSPWGDGIAKTNENEGLEGVEFGQLNGVTLDVLSLGGRWKISEYDISFSLAKSQGTREIIGNKENKGFYLVDINSLSGGIKRSF